MKSITDHVRDQLNQQPFYKDLLSKDLLNATAFARLIKPTVEKNIGEKVSVNAIAMALQRMKNEYKPTLVDYASYIKDISFQKDLVRVRMDDFHNISFPEFYFVSKTLNNHSLVCRQADLPSDLTCNTELLSAITFTYSDGHSEVVGLNSFIIARISYAGITLPEIISSFSELTIIIDSNETKKVLSLFI